jgi:copper homeostasis protein (lipoprotein)
LNTVRIILSINVMRILSVVLIVFVGILSTACIGGIEVSQKTILLLADSKECGESSEENNCLLVKWDLNQEKWENFSYDIKGFEYELGYEYEVVVLVTKVDNPPIEGTGNKYKLLNVLAKREVENDKRDGHNSFNSVDWEGTYESIIPCADCRGIKTIITLNLDSTYHRSEEYLGKNEKPFTDTGKYIWDKSGNQITLIDQKRNQKYKVGEEHLLHLDRDGNVIQGELAQQYVLKKSYPSIEDKNWHLVTFMNKGVVGDSEQFFIHFKSSDKSLKTKTGCNLLFSSYELEGPNGILIRRLGGTRVGCSHTIEEDYAALLINVDSYVLSKDGKKLQLKIENEVIAEYLAK